MYKFVLSFCLLFLTGTQAVLAKDLITLSRNMYLHCQGTKGPVIVLISGYRDRGDGSWDSIEGKSKNSTVFTKVSQFAKVCLYDRPGTIKINKTTFDKSRSTPVLQPISAKEAVADLHSLLQAAKIPPPYIFAAHSAGGLIARLYASIYPKDVAGMVLVDVTTEDLKDKWTAKEWKIFDYSTQLIPDDLKPYKDLEVIDFAQSFKQLKDRNLSINKLKMPAIVLSSDQIPNAAKIIEAGFWPQGVSQDTATHIFSVIQEAQNDLANSFVPKAKHLAKTNSGHYIQKEHPELVVDSIRELWLDTQ